MVDFHKILKGGDMSLQRIAFVVAMTMNVSPSFAQNSLPHFEQFPIADSDQFLGTPAPVDIFSYPGANKFRAQLEDGAAKGPNYAGHYTIVTLSCGTMCQDNWVIDAPTGKIVGEFKSKIYLRYQPDSTLLVVNPPDPDIKKGYDRDPQQPIWKTIETKYQVFQNAKFEVVQKNKWVDLFDWMSGGN